MTPAHLKALLEGLDVPSPEWWMVQPPEKLKMLGKSISDQAKQVKGNSSFSHDELLPDA